MLKKKSESSTAENGSSKITIFFYLTLKKSRVSVRLVVIRTSSLVDRGVPSLMDIMGT